MKRLAVVFVCLICLQACALADGDKPIKINELPLKAQEFIKTHFADQKVSLAKLETDALFFKSYDIVFTSGIKLEFDSEGEWTNVDCKLSVVPEAIIPEAIKAYALENYPDNKIVQIEREHGRTEITFNNKIEFTFDKNYRVVEVDD